MTIDPYSGPGRFIYDLRKIYDPYPFQASFHASPSPYGFLGGAAGPGKTIAGLMEQFISCNEFNADDGPKVHTLTLRRTNPKLEATVITRFRETFPKELYRQFNETKNQVTWLNGATTKFGSMQYDYNAWDYQGQWFHIYYDELCEFTFNQWMATSAWNRCPVSPFTRKYGSGNPIGIGALWVEDLFVKHVPCTGMDDDQKAFYSPTDYDYFPATYRDNPKYANNPQFLANLMSYPAAVRDALKEGKWGVASGYFRDIWDEAVHTFNNEDVPFMPWWKRWISGNWGYEHPASFYKHCMDDHGVVYTYDEMVVQHQSPEKLAESVGNWAIELVDGVEKMPHFQNFAFSFDAQRSMQTSTMGENSNSIANRMTPVLRTFGIPAPFPSTRDKVGRDTLMRERLEKRLRVGESDTGHFIEVPNWQISKRCKELIRVIPIVKSDDADPEKIEAVNDGSDSPLQGAGYGLYAIFGKPAPKPRHVQLAQVLKAVADQSSSEDEAYIRTQQSLAGRRFDVDWTKSHQPVRRKLKWSRPSLHL